MAMREDYIIRHIRQFLQALMGIRSLAQIRQEHAALLAVNETAAQLLGIRSTAAASISIRELVGQLTVSEWSQLGREARAALAALLKEAGLIHARQDRRVESSRCYVLALHLMLDIAVNEPTLPLPDFAPTVEELVTFLRGYMLPRSLSALLLQYYEQQGAFGHAEDVLFAMRGSEPESMEVHDIGKSFYHRLLLRSDDELIAGNLPRDEVESGLANLRGE